MEYLQFHRFSPTNHLRVVFLNPRFFKLKLKTLFCNSALLGLIMPTFEYYLGIAFALLATSMFNSVPILQKQALEKMADLNKDNFIKTMLALLKDKKWVLGLIVGISGGIPFTIAVVWTGITVVQPLMSFGFIVLAIASTRVLGEKLNKSAKISIGLMILMPVAIAFADVSMPRNDITETATQINLYLFSVGVFILIVSSWLIAYKKPIFWAGVMGLFFTIGAYFAQGTLSLIEFAGYNLLTQFSVVLKNMFSDPNLRLAFLYIIIGLIFNIGGGAVSQIGFQKVAASKFNPIQQTINNIASIIGGILIFGQNIGNWWFYSIGMICAVIGTYVLGSYQMETERKPKPSLEQN